MLGYFKVHSTGKLQVAPPGKQQLLVASRLKTEWAPPSLSLPSFPPFRVFALSPSLAAAAPASAGRGAAGSLRPRPRWVPAPPPREPPCRRGAATSLNAGHAASSLGASRQAAGGQSLTSGDDQARHVHVEIEQVELEIVLQHLPHARVLPRSCKAGALLSYAAISGR